MPASGPRPGQVAVQVSLAAIFVSLELSRSTWLITSLVPGGGDKMSKHSVRSGDIAELMTHDTKLRDKAHARAGASFPIIAIQEAGLDGFWVHRVLEQAGIESHVVDAASVLTSRRRRRAKTDRIDGEALLRTLLAYKRGEPRVCAMVRAPSPEEEDRRRLCRERKTLVAERIAHVNRIKGLLFAQGVADYEPLRRDRSTRLDERRTKDDRTLPPRLRREIERELQRLELVLEQLEAVEAERDAAVAASAADDADAAKVALLTKLGGIGNELATVLVREGLYRSFTNRKEVAAYAGLTPMPFASGERHREQGISKAGNPRLRHTMVQLVWLWLRHQKGSALSAWYRARVGGERGRIRRIMVVALARKLLIALWRYVTQGVVPEGAMLKPV